jgi:S-adenosylmethionine-dependent methyltransferase
MSSMTFEDAIIERVASEDPLEAGWPPLRAGLSLGDAIIAIRAATPERSSGEVLSQLLALERRGCLTLTLRHHSAPMAAVEAALGALDRAVEVAPALHGHAGYEIDRRRFPGIYAWLGSGSDLDRLKRFERDLYLEHLSPRLDALPPGARVLDAGCGIGRMAAPLARRGLSLTLVDGSPHALKLAVAQVLDGDPGGPVPEAWAADSHDLGFLADDRFELTLAMELLCYQEEPARMLRELVRVTCPGGLIAVAVEGRYGALLRDTSCTLDEAEARLDGAPLVRPCDVFLRTFTAPELGALLEGAGLECLSLVGTHYLPEGPLAHVMDGVDLDDEATRRRLLALERRCAADPALAPLARAWLAVARKPLEAG